MAKNDPCSTGVCNVDVPFDWRGFFEELDFGLGESKLDGFTAVAGSVGPWEQSLDPTAYGCSSTYRVDYLRAMILKKFDDEKSSEIKKIRAFEKFYASEESCRHTNQYLLSDLRDVRVHFLTGSSIFFAASRKIAEWMGDFDWNEAFAYMHFGKGSTTRHRYSSRNRWYKISGTPETTANNLASATAYLRQAGHYWPDLRWDLDRNPQVVVAPGNKVTTVPKNSKIDRIIAIEPELNLMVQYGIGGIIRDRLKRVGCDLSDQSRNQRMAKSGSKTGFYATIDLSSASDSVSLGLCGQLLPPALFEALLIARSESGVTPSGTVTYEKVSSMGCGFTFELESMIFYALALAVAESYGYGASDVSVYGDDIIVPSHCYRLLTDVLLACGFKTNHDKTFASGPFRESCGKHYFNGDDVTPFFLSSFPRRLNDVFLLHNNVVRWCASKYVSVRDGGKEGALAALAAKLRASVPRKWERPRIPDGYGDGAFIGDFDECVPKPAVRDSKGAYSGVEGYWTRTIREKPVVSDPNGPRRLFYIGACVQSSLVGADGRLSAEDPDGSSVAMRLRSLGDQRVRSLFTPVSEPSGFDVGRWVREPLMVEPILLRASVDRHEQSKGTSSRRSLDCDGRPDPASTRSDQRSPTEACGSRLGGFREGVVETPALDSQDRSFESVRLLVTSWGFLGPWVTTS